MISANSTYVLGRWNADFAESMKPKDGDIVVSGKRGLDAFPGTDLQESLMKNGIETLAIGGFLTNCCGTRTHTPKHSRPVYLHSADFGTGTVCSGSVLVPVARRFCPPSLFL